MRQLISGLALLGLVAVALQGCGDCPAQVQEEEEKKHFTREEAITNMLCQNAVAEALAQIETNFMDQLKGVCLDAINDIENLPKGRFKVEEHCESWGSEHFLNCHSRAEAFMEPNCTKWADVKMQPSNITEGRVKHLFDSASECLTSYSEENEDDLELAKSFYKEALHQTRNQTDALIAELEAQARKSMNDMLGKMHEAKFELWRMVVPTSSSTLVFSGAVLSMLVGVLAVQALRRMALSSSRSELGAEDPMVRNDFFSD